MIKGWIWASITKAVFSGKELSQIRDQEEKFRG